MQRNYIGKSDAAMRRCAMYLAAITWMMACIAVPPIAYAQDRASAPASVTIGMITRSGSAVVPRRLAANTELQQKYGLKVVLKEFANVQAIYTGMATGEIEVMVGSPDGFAAQARRGIPVQIMSTFAISSAQIFGTTGPITSAEQLKGKRVTAVVAGLWRLTEAQIAEKYGLRANRDYELISVPNLLTGVTQVLAGTADYAMGWETDATLARNKYPQLKLVLSTKELKPAGEETHMQVFGSRTTLAKAVEQRTISALAEELKKVYEDPAAVDAEYSKWANYEPGIFSSAILSSYPLVIRPLTDADLGSIKNDLKKIAAENVDLPAAFFQR